MFRLRKKNTKETLFVHIGKCGGSTATKALGLQGRFHRVRVIHVSKPPACPAKRYFILLRNPIARAISAFNWRFKLVVDEAIQKDRFPGEWGVLKQYGTLDRLARALYDENGEDNKQAQSDFRIIHHLKEDISFYLSDLLEYISPAQVIGVLTQENLNDDICRFFGLRLDIKEKHNSDKTSPEKLTLSDRGARNLRRFLVKDFECIARLHCWGKIDDKTFEQLWRWPSSSGEPGNQTGELLTTSASR